MEVPFSNRLELIHGPGAPHGVHAICTKDKPLRSSETLRPERCWPLTQPAVGRVSVKELALWTTGLFLLLRGTPFSYPFRARGGGLPAFRRRKCWAQACHFLEKATRSTLQRHTQRTLKMVVVS